MHIERRKVKIPILVTGKAETEKNPRTGLHRDRRTEGKPVGICVSEEAGGPFEGMEGPSGSGSMGFFLVSTPPGGRAHGGVAHHDGGKGDGHLGHRWQKGCSLHGDQQHGH